MVTKKAEHVSHETMVPKKNPKPIDWLKNMNENENFAILKQGRGYQIKHISLAEPLSVSLDLQQAVELRRLLKKLEIANDSCTKRFSLNECLLENPKKSPLTQTFLHANDVFRAKDGAFKRIITEPVLAREHIPGSLGSITDQSVGPIKDYLNLAMNASNPSPVTVAKQ